MEKKAYSKEHIPYALKQAEYECLGDIKITEGYYREIFPTFGKNFQDQVSILDLNGFPGDKAIALSRIFRNAEIFVSDKTEALQQAIWDCIQSEKMVTSKKIEVVNRNALFERQYDIILLLQEQFRSESREELEDIIIASINQLKKGGILAVKFRKGFIEGKKSYITDVNLADDFMLRLKTIDCGSEKYNRYLQYISEQKELTSEIFVGHSISYLADDFLKLIGNSCDILEKTITCFGHSQFYLKKR